MAGGPWGRLTERAEFLRAGKGRRIASPSLTLQANFRDPKTAASDGDAAPRFGLTVTKKTGNSPARHRIKRRLREAMRKISPLDARPDHDYVLMARREALSTPFDALVEEIAVAIRRAHQSREARRDANR